MLITYKEAGRDEREKGKHVQYLPDLAIAVRQEDLHVQRVPCTTLARCAISSAARFVAGYVCRRNHCETESEVLLAGLENGPSWQVCGLV